MSAVSRDWQADGPEGAAGGGEGASTIAGGAGRGAGADGGVRAAIRISAGLSRGKGTARTGAIFGAISIGRWRGGGAGAGCTRADLRTARLFFGAGGENSRSIDRPISGKGESAAAPASSRPITSASAAAPSTTMVRAVKGAPAVASRFVLGGGLRVLCGLARPVTVSRRRDRLAELSPTAL